MAEKAQLERLKRSVNGWNKWRRDHPEIQPNLVRASLCGADLNGANLGGANLGGADLGGAKLAEANLQRADLGEADLSRVILYRANLGETILSGASLSWAILSRAILYETDFTHTHFRETIFAHIDLNNVRGLETAIHSGPSTVNINSVVLPRDESTRLHFLRGVGFTETQIEYLPSLLTPRPIQYHSLFISNANPDQAIARRLYADLRKNDVPCWFASHDLRPGNYYRQGIDQAIHSQDRVLLLLSEHSIQSGWVRHEVELALARENDQHREILYPVCLDQAIFDCTTGWARSLRATRHIGDFTAWQDDDAYQQAFAALLRHLKVTQPPTP